MFPVNLSNGGIQYIIQVERRAYLFSSLWLTSMLFYFLTVPVFIFSLYALIKENLEHNKEENLNL